MATVFVKTEAGQQEIRERTRALPRFARTLLVLADGARSAEQLLGMVQGSAAPDLQALVDQGLLAEVFPAGSFKTSSGHAPLASPAPPAAAPTAAPAPAGADEGLGYQELYDSLNALSKEQLGLFKGFKFALEIEKAKNLIELRDVAEHLAEEVQKAKGDSAAQMVRRALGLKR
jgi:hypothetical protein